MIANIQGYHVSVVTLVLSFFPPPSSLQAKLSPHSAAPHQCRIASYKATAPDLHLYCCTAQGLHHSSGLTSEPAVPTQRCGSCRVLWPVPHCVTQAVRPLSDCISTFSQWWTGCSCQDQPSQNHSPATFDRWEVGISELMSVRTSPSPQDITESQSEKSDAMLQHYRKPNAHPHGWKGCFSCTSPS